MRLTHIFSRLTCRWHWEWLSTAAWSAMAHAPAVALLSCVAVGGVVWARLPVDHQDVAPLVTATPWDISDVPVQNVPEPWSGALLAVGVVGVLAVRL